MRCVELLILNDNLFEFEEKLTGEIIRVTDTDQVPLTVFDGLTINPIGTEINIEDNDGMFMRWYMNKEFWGEKRWRGKEYGACPDFT